LRSLTREDFDLEGNPATVTVRAAYSKHRRDDTLPLRPETAAALAEYLARKLPNVAAFPMPATDKGALMLREDLAATGGEGMDPIPAKDDQGRVVDFHALRHTFVTNLCNGGVHPKTAQALARHSTITLTMDRYTHLTAASQTDALDALPDLDALPETGKATATGTEDGGKNLSPILSFRERRTADRCNELRQMRGKKAKGQSKRKARQTQGNPAFPGLRQVVPPEGFEPTTRGLRIRCSAS
jgi:hypothetical protein